MTHEWSNTNPIWTPDSLRVTFASDRDGRGNIYGKAVDGSGGIERLTENEYKQWPSSWSPDGKTLAFVEQHDQTGMDIWLLELDGDRQPEPFLVTTYNELGPVFSPDGRWLAYQSSETGPDEIYVQPYPRDGRKWSVSTRGGSYAVWSPDSKRLQESRSLCDARPGVRPRSRLARRRARSGLFHQTYPARHAQDLESMPG